MTAAFIVTLDIQDDTDFVSIAEELKDSINSHFQYECVEAKAFPREATKPLVAPPPTAGGLIPPPQQ
jgi:hypothetical protein